MTEDDAQVPWKPSDGAGHCYELHGLAQTRDLEPIRRAWMRDEPNCPRNAPRVKATLKLDALPDSKLTAPGAPTCFATANATLLGIGPPRALGHLAQMCGVGSVRHIADPLGIEVEVADDSTVRRIAYQLGDRVYYTPGDGRVHAVDLPCGARIAFDVVAPAYRTLRRQAH